MPSARNCEVRAGEIVSLAKEWLGEDSRQRIREAIAVIESCGVAAFAQTAKRFTREVGLLAVHRNNFDTGTGEEGIEMAETLGAESRFDHDRSFDQGRCGDVPDICAFERFNQRTALGFIPQDRNKGRSIHDH